ncbi:glycosyltransferase family 4 protein [Proteus mirabilis]|uniref:glycosyltransferase family 4 protein n=1 Tax=Proteus mirabilis TaxID=584 RepID=UPI002015FD3B|nr:glycosyltransferase family 4 protein [Proteus mirabilis]
MNICFFIGDIGLTGGTERVTSVIANELDKLNNNIYILSLKNNNKSFFYLNKNITTKKIFSSSKYGKLRLPLAIWKIRQFIIQNNIDIFISVESMLSLYSIPASIGLNVRNICWEHFNFNVNLGKRSRDFARKLAAYYANDIITLTKHDKNLWLNNLNCKANIVTINNPITIKHDQENYIPMGNKKEKIFLAVGRLTYQKGFDLLLEAWGIISSKYPDWKLNIIGDGEDKLLLNKLIQQKKISNSVSILPPTKNIQDHYEKSAYYILSSRFEGFGLVILEAQSKGLPVISFDCETGPNEIIIDKKTGWLCENSNIEDLSKKIIKAIELFNSDKKKYINISNNAMINSKKFSIENIIPKWITLLNIESNKNEK